MLTRSVDASCSCHEPSRSPKGSLSSADPGHDLGEASLRLARMRSTEHPNPGECDGRKDRQGRNGRGHQTRLPRQAAECQDLHHIHRVGDGQGFCAAEFAAYPSSSAAVSRSLSSLVAYALCRLCVDFFLYRLPLGRISMDTQTGDYIEYFNTIGTELRTLFATANKPLPPIPTLVTLPRTVPAQPLPVSSSIVGSWLGSWVGGALTGAQIDVLSKLVRFPTMRLLEARLTSRTTLCSSHQSPVHLVQHRQLAPLTLLCRTQQLERLLSLRRPPSRKGRLLLSLVSRERRGRRGILISR
jgi:hypothetical protein